MSQNLVSKCPRYPAYKDSGVEWLGDIPVHWEVKKIKRLTTVKRGASPRPIDNPIYFDDNGDYSWVRISDVTASNKYLEITQQKLSELGKSKSIPLEPGELFLSICATVGKPIITKIKCCIHDGFVYFPYLKENRDYLFYIFSSGELYKGLGKFGTQLNLNTDIIGDIKLPIPPLEEQKAIALFLDKETTNIDNLIASKQRLIELLKEKRTALISHVVTKGLNPDVAYKDSGVEWLGEIPAHWEVKRLKYISQVIAGQSPSEETYNTDGVGIILVNGPAEYSQEDFGLTRELKWTTQPLKIAPKYSLLLCLRGSTTGRLNIAHTEVCIGRGVAALVANYSQGFLNYSMISLRKYILATSRGSTFPSITTENLSNYLLTFPPLEEQKIIALFLDKEITRIDTLITKTTTSIEYFKEYRTAIISAAVTGKIDVFSVETSK